MGLLEKLQKSTQYLLEEKSRAFGFLATTMENGTPQVTPVWFDHDNAHILINSAVGRIKDINMRARPEVAICIFDPDQPYRYAQIRGRVVEITEEGAYEHIKSLNYKYHGKREFPAREGEVRVTYNILPYGTD